MALHIIPAKTRIFGFPKEAIVAKDRHESDSIKIGMDILHEAQWIIADAPSAVSPVILDEFHGLMKKEVGDLSKEKSDALFYSRRNRQNDFSEMNKNGLPTKEPPHPTQE
jgi:hypothetical protein